MDFSTVELDEETRSFWEDVRSFLAEQVTPALLEEERVSGSGFAEGLHLAMGGRGWLVPAWPRQNGGAGLDAVRQRLLEVELRRCGAPGILRGTTMLTVGTIRRHARPDLADEVLAGVAAGNVRICLGYTEPDTGSDLAAVRTRAFRDGDEWVIDGQKMFTTGAQHSQYCFLLARTNTEAPKHKGLTVFLVPLDHDGIQITPVDTLGGERTNFVYYDSVRIDDRFRVGAVDDGWNVVHGALDAEHGLAVDDNGLGEFGGMHYEHTTEVVLRAIEAWSASEDPEAPDLEDPLVRMRLARAALNVELSSVAPSPHCRVLSAETLVDSASDLVDLVGPLALLPGPTASGAAAAAEHAFRFAPGTAIYGGTTEVFKNMVAERFLGLPRSTPRG